jgi:WD40 repeat protein
MSSITRRIVPLVLIGTAWTGVTAAQQAPSVVWQFPTPNGLANSVTAVGWSPLGDSLAVGSTDRWFRLRNARDGAIAYSVLEPQHSSGPGQIVYSIDGGLVGVVNRSFTMSIRVQRADDGAALGNVLATVEADGLVTFAPDATLLASTGGDGTLSRWRFSDFTIFRTTGSGYRRVTTAFDFSPDGVFQTAARQGQITVQLRSDGTVVQVLAGGSEGVFSPDSSLFAAWSATPDNRITVWRTSDWGIALSIPASNVQEGVAGLRFTADGRRLVVTGYDPYLDQDGLWQQRGFIRFLRVADGATLWNFDQQTGIAVTCAVAFSPNGRRFAYGTYEGDIAVALTPP